MARDKLIVAEQFHSIQGEGPSIGKPAIFLRLTGCNFTCPGWLRDPKGNLSGCDSIETWKQGSQMSFQDIIDHWKKEKWIPASDGTILVITGGEPLLQQEGLISFLETLIQDEQANNLWIEIETNASIVPLPQFDQYINQYNVSPKLKSSGETNSKRISPVVLKFFVESEKAYFKFVVSEEEDIFEIQELQKEFVFGNNKVMLMPAGGTREALFETTPAVVELCKKHGYRYSAREHIWIWDKSVGV